MKSVLKIKNIILILGIIFGIATVAAPTSFALNVFGGCSTNSSDTICQAKNDQVTPFFQRILSLLMYAIGAVAVIMIVIGGIKFAISNGDANAVQSAKTTILYSVAGLVVAILGQAIILFVVNWIK
jgi:hypothetical protein